MPQVIRQNIHQRRQITSGNSLIPRGFPKSRSTRISAPGLVPQIPYVESSFLPSFEAGRGGS